MMILNKLKRDLCYRLKARSVGKKKKKKKNTHIHI